MTAYFLCLVMFCIGLYCILRKRNIIKIIIGLGIIDYSVSLFFVLIGYRLHGRSPILAGNQTIVNMVDPLPQAMVLTTIVLGLAVTMVTVSIAVRIYGKYGTFDITKIKRLKG